MSLYGTCSRFTPSGLDADSTVIRWLCAFPRSATRSEGGCRWSGNDLAGELSATGFVDGAAVPALVPDTDACLDVVYPVELCFCLALAVHEPACPRRQNQSPALGHCHRRRPDRRIRPRKVH